MELSQLKIVVLGEANAGKSSLICRYTTGQFKETLSSVSSGLHTKLLTLPKGQIKLNIWDTVGEEKHNSISRLYYRNADIFFLVYDLSENDSAIGLKNWYQCIRKEDDTLTAKVYIIASKLDILFNDTSELQGKHFAEEIGVKFFKTSAKTGVGIEDLFLAVASNITPSVSNPLTRKSINLNDFKPHIMEKKKKKFC